MPRPGPLQNRVAPTGEVIADPARGLMMGNRGGRLHTADRQLGVRRWTSNAWIACRLDWRGRRRQIMGPGYTELFFLDEATALAAGHRPCFACRRADALAFQALWQRAAGLAAAPPASAMDATLHQERRANAATRVPRIMADLPDGAMVLWRGAAWLIAGGNLAPWTPAGYGPPRRVPRRAAACVLTPACTLAILAQGYRPLVHRSAPRPLAP